MAGKLPAWPLYTGDWLKDTGVLTVAAAGAWIRILVAMWNAEPRGRLTLTMAAFGRLIGTTSEEAAILIEELVVTKVCNRITECSGNITLINRRMDREEKDRNSNRIRQKSWRDRSNNNTEVTLLLSSSLSSSKETTPPTPSSEGGRKQRKKPETIPAETYDPSWQDVPWPSVRRFVAEHNRKTPDWWPSAKSIESGRVMSIQKALKQFADPAWWDVVFANIHRGNSWMRDYHNRGLDWLLQGGQHDGVLNAAKVFDGKYVDAKH